MSYSATPQERAHARGWTIGDCIELEGGGCVAVEAALRLCDASPALDRLERKLDWLKRAMLGDRTKMGASGEWPGDLPRAERATE